MTKKQQAKGRFMVIMGAIIILMVVNAIFGLAWPSLLVQAGPTLPPREPSPVAPPDSDDDDDDDSPIGAHIELQVQPARSGLWSTIEWQDSAGGWHKVEGWDRALDASGSEFWWVEAKDFDTGPFHWLVTEGSGGALLGASQPFNLPEQANTTTRVVVSLEP